MSVLSLSLRTSKALSFYLSSFAQFYFSLAISCSLLRTSSSYSFRSSFIFSNWPILFMLFSIISISYLYFDISFSCSIDTLTKRYFRFSTRLFVCSFSIMLIIYILVSRLDSFNCEVYSSRYSTLFVWSLRLFARDCLSNLSYDISAESEATWL